MPRLNPYINYPGNAEEAFNLYKSVFGGEFAMVQRFKDTPEASRVAPADADKMMHIALPIGKGNVLMATDAVESMGQKLTPGNNHFLSISTDSKEEADRIFNGLSASGKVLMPLADTFWGAYFGMLIDAYGVQWMIGYDKTYADLP